MRRGAARRTIQSLCGLGLLAGAFAFLPAGRADNDPLVRLASDALEVTIAPGLGARIVELRPANGDNLLHADPAHWKEPYPPAELKTPFGPWNGHTYWVGPQSRWWTQQDLDAERRVGKAIWPPDPFHEAARYDVRERTKARARLESPPSPVTGLRRVLEVTLVDPRRVSIRVTATNVRSTPVSWDIWSNTRVRSEGWAYVQLAGDGVRRFDKSHDGSPAYPHSRVRDWFVSAPGFRPEGAAVRRTSKAFLRPVRPEVAYFRGPWLVRKSTAPVAEERLHPEQAAVEIYRSGGRTAADDLLELEMHGAFETLAPGQSISFEESWEVLGYDGAAEPEAHVRFLEGQRGGTP